MAFLHFLLGNSSVFCTQGNSFLFVLFSKTFVFKAWLAILNILLVSLSLPCLHLNETSLFFWFASSPGSLLVLPCIQIIEKLPAASLFTPNLQRARLLFLVGLCCYILGLYLDSLNSSNSMERFSAQFPMVEKSSKYVVGTLLPGFGYWESALPFWWASGLC